VIPRVNDDLPEELPARYKYCCPGHPSWTVLKFEVTLLAGFQMGLPHSWWSGGDDFCIKQISAKVF
jgi:hypothetical protein